MASGAYSDLFERWPVWARIVRSVSSGHAAEVDPCDIFGAACAQDLDRLAARIYGDNICASIEEVRDLVDELLDDAREGRRPKSWPEMGLTPEMFR